MHEVGLVDDILCVIKAKLKEAKDASKVKRINILIGELEHLAPDHFTFHFKERTRGTVLEDAELNFKKVRARFRCSNCGHEFSAEDGLEGCPDCKGKLNRVVSGTGIFVESVELA